MKFLLGLKNYFDSLESKDFKKYVLIALAILLGCIGLLNFNYFRSIAALKKRIQMVNRKRKDAQGILERYERVKKQQIAVNSVLAKEKDFKISQYFQSLIEKLTMQSNLTQPTEVLAKDVLNDYTEWTLYANLANLTTKKLGELLYAIEQEERIYTKDLEIEKSLNNKFINVKITIATLEPKAELQKTSE